MLGEAAEHDDIRYIAGWLRARLDEDAHEKALKEWEAAERKRARSLVEDCIAFAKEQGIKLTANDPRLEEMVAQMMAGQGNG